MTTPVSRGNATGLVVPPTAAGKSVTYDPYGIHLEGALGDLPMVGPTVSMDPRPIVIPIISCVIGVPVVAFAIICALRYRAQRLRKKDQIRRIKSGIRSVTLELPTKDRVSYYSRDSSSDRPPTDQRDSAEEPRGSPCRSRTLRNSNHVKFVTTTALLHLPGFDAQNGNIRNSVSEKESSMIWEEASFIENPNEVCAELVQLDER